MYNLDRIFDDNEKNLLLHSVNVYLEKLDFVIKNGKYYDTPSLVISSLEEDYFKLIRLREKLFYIENVTSNLYLDTKNFEEGS